MLYMNVKCNESLKSTQHNFYSQINQFNKCNSGGEISFLILSHQPAHNHKREYEYYSSQEKRLKNA